jgi:hypothetical protein
MGGLDVERFFDLGVRCIGEVHKDDRDDEECRRFLCGPLIFKNHVDPRRNFPTSVLIHDAS